MIERIRYLLLSLLLSGFIISDVFAQSAVVEGRIIDAATSEPMPFVNLILVRDGIQQASGITNTRGEFRVPQLPPGNYVIRATHMGHEDYTSEEFYVAAGAITRRGDLRMIPIGIDLTGIVFETDRIPVFDIDDRGGTRLGREEIGQIPVRGINDIAAITAGTYAVDGGVPNIRGGRDDATIYYVDGVRVRGTLGLPQGAIEEIATITGGVPVEFGDAIGGVINVSTRGAAAKHFGGFEVISSQFLDPYGLLIFEGNAGGPLFKKFKDSDTERVSVGYFLAASLQYRKDYNPPAIDIWRVKDDVLEDMLERPLVENPDADNFISKAELMTKDSMTTSRIRQNSDDKSANITGRLDFQLAENITLTAGAQFSYRDRNIFQASYSLYSFDNHPQDLRQTYRGYLRFTQRFVPDPEEQIKQRPGSKFVIENAYYSLHVDYTKFLVNEQNRNLQDDFFKYGYLGKYEIYRAPSYSQETRYLKDVGEDVHAWYQTGFRDTMVTFEAADYNRNNANYTTQYYELERRPTENMTQLQQRGGLRNGDMYGGNGLVHELWRAPGTPWSIYRKWDQDHFNINAVGAAIISGHELRFGIQYEQQIERFYGLNANRLWSEMRAQVNTHFEGMDTSNPIYVYADGMSTVYDPNRPFMDSVKFNPYIASEPSTFDKNLRDKLIESGEVDENGRPIDQYTFLNTDRYDPDMYSLDMFAPDNFMYQGVNPVAFFRGFDHTGQKITSSPTLEDFLDNPEKRWVSPYTPIYLAGFIEDRFSFRDLIFRVGVRVDRFDANQQILKDPFLLYPARTAGSVDEIQGISVTHPGTIGDDYIVYTDRTFNPTRIVGYRDGDKWYDASGNETADPTQIARATQSGQISPYLVAESSDEVRLTSESFEDYTPHIAVMPRVSFSFPISDEAVFFANYDVLTQRPRGRNDFNIDDYYYLEQRALSPINNPDLKPERRTNYEVGFRQRLTPSSAISLQAFYGEIKDMVQVVPVNEAYPVSYSTYGNVDFGTVKGFIMSYDLRRSRTSNVRMRINYTLQFADGTGSGPTSQSSLVSAGFPNLRTPMPLNYDVRHNLVTSLDYRYLSGEFYNGPLTKNGKEILANTGASFIFSAVSGAPYSRQRNIYQEASIGIRQSRTLDGSVNSARLPWQFTTDMKIDRSFLVKMGTEEVDGRQVVKRSFDLNVYFWVQNLFDAQNVRNVYRYTGAPNDDGFLSSAEGQQRLRQEGERSEAYFDQYSIKVNNPANYTLPRRIQIGAIVSF